MKLESLKVTEGAQRKVEEIPQVDGAVKNVKHLTDKSSND